LSIYFVIKFIYKILFLYDDFHPMRIRIIDEKTGKISFLIFSFHNSWTFSTDIWLRITFEKNKIKV